LLRKLLNNKKSQKSYVEELKELEKAKNIGIVVILLKIEFCEKMEKKYKNKEEKVLKNFVKKLRLQIKL